MGLLTRKITTYLKNIKDLSDTPNRDGLDAAGLKAFFDGRTDAEVKDAINGMIDDLTSAASGGSGAGQIGSTPLKEGGASTVQTQLEELKIDKVENTTLEEHKTSADHDAHIATLHYTKIDMQSAGTAQLHWDNLIGVPNLADSHWKPPVANRAALPLTGNELADQRVVFDDGDGKQAVYTCVATTGTVDQQWNKVADVDWMSTEATREAQETARVTAESNRVSAEDLRATAENNRNTKETNRISAENARVTAENGRVTVETNRATAETGRVNAENARVIAENNRIHMGEYDALTAYKVGNEVSYLGSSYRCILASTGNLPTNISYWVLIAQKGMDGSGAGDMSKSVYDPSSRNQDIFAYVDSKATTADITYYVSTTGNDSNAGLTSGTAFKTIQKAIDSIPKVVNHTVTINVAAGTYPESVITVSGFTGSGTLYISGSSTKDNTRSLKNIAIFNNSILVDVRNFYFTGTAYPNKIIELTRTYATIRGCIIEPSEPYQDGIYVEMSTVSLMYNSISNTSAAINAKEGSSVKSISNSGTGNEVGYYISYNAVIANEMGQPSGTAAHIIMENGGQHIDGNTNVNKLAEQISTVSAEKAETETYPAILTTTWTGAEAPYIQAIAVEGITVDDNPIVDIVLTGTYATDVQIETDWANIYRIVTSANTVTFYAHAKPTGSIPLQIKAVR